MEAKSTGYTKSRKKIAEAVKQTVCAWLEWDAMQYAEFQYESGQRYLRFYIPQDAWGRDMLERSRLFWNWWKLQWINRDIQFTDVEAGEHEMTVANLRRHYRHLHDPANLASEIYPGRTVLDDSYCTMMSNIIKEVVHA